MTSFKEHRHYIAKRVGGGGGGLVQSESDDTFVAGVKAKELEIIGSSVLLFLFQWENKTKDLITIGSVTFGIQIKMSSSLLCPTPPYKFDKNVGVS